MNLKTEPKQPIVITNWKWMLDSSFCLVFAMLHGLILFVEINRRKSNDVTFVSKYVKMWPMICILSGLCIEICGFVAFFPVFCHFSRQLEFVLSGVQGVSMGFFQLSRLYYLFNSSSKGYSNIVFGLMYGTGILILVTITISSMLAENVDYCAFDNKLNYIEDTEYLVHWHHWFEKDIHDDHNVIYLFLSCICVYVLWDVITLILYIWKLIPLYHGREHDNKVKAILYKIIILTALYQFTVVLVLNDVFIELISESNIIHIDSILAFIFLEGLLSTSMSLAIFLMQSHNYAQYKQFLKVVYFIKCHRIFCCCDSVIRYELPELEKASAPNSYLPMALELRHLKVERENVEEIKEETPIALETFTHGSGKQGFSRDSIETKTNQNQEMSSATPMCRPVLRRDQVSDIGDSKTGSSDTFKGIKVSQNIPSDSVKENQMSNNISSNL